MFTTHSSRHEQSTRTWWSSSKPTKYPGPPNDMSPQFMPSDKASRSSGKSSGSKFNTLASAMGFKSKKHPSLAIQDPPPMPIRTVVSTVVSEERTRHYTTRPPSKSISSTVSQAESPEPRTPLDNQRDFRHQSLLTLSDADPFASTGMTPRSPVDPNRLSAYSNSSIEYSKRSDMAVNRGSYASSSSQGHADVRSISSMPYSPDGNVKRTVTSKKSVGDIRRSASANANGVRDAAWGNMAKSPKLNALSSLPDKNRYSQPEVPAASRPIMRPRGLTESGGIQAPNLFSEVKPVDKTSPRVIVRQASMQRMGLPPSAPPTHRLPTPPSVDVDAFLPNAPHSFYDGHSASATRDDEYMPNQHYIPREDRHGRDAPQDTGSTVDLSSSPRAPRTLKKSISHQSLSKRGSTTSHTSPPTPTEPVEKGPRKQRSFHHPRIPMPPIPLPLRHTNSSGSTVHQPEITEKRGSSGGHPTQRKRLFSGSSFGRPTTASSSSHNHGEDDNRSIFSLPADDRDGNGSLSKAFSPSSSFWEESSPRMSRPPEYVPQHIMSAAEMLQVEASVQESLTNRKQRERGMSVMSSATNVSEFSIAEGLAAPFSSGSCSSLSPSSPYSRAMSNSQTTLTSVTSNSFYSPPSTSTSTNSLHSSSQRNRPRVANAETGIIPLSPPPRTKVRRKREEETSSLHRSSTTKKPSFLDIDDDIVRRPRSSPSSPKVHTPPDGSFLDLARESFESERSLDR